MKIASPPNDIFSYQVQEKKGRNCKNLLFTQHWFWSYHANLHWRILKRIQWKDGKKKKIKAEQAAGNSLRIPLILKAVKQPHWYPHYSLICGWLRPLRFKMLYRKQRGWMQSENVLSPSQRYLSGNTEGVKTGLHQPRHFHSSSCIFSSVCDLTMRCVKKKRHLNLLFQL